MCVQNVKMAFSGNTRVNKIQFLCISHVDVVVADNISDLFFSLIDF